MNKELLIMRHAKAVRINWEGDDFSRPLTPKGRIDAIERSKQLMKLGKLPQLILSSAAARTMETSYVVLETSGIEIPLIQEEDLYLASSSHIQHFIQGVENRFDRIMLVGHNPGLEYFCNSLARKKRDIILATSTLVHFELEIKCWDEICMNCAEFGFILERNS